MTQNQSFPDLSLFLGGARSGKSVLAENLVIQSGLKPVYLATAEIRDTEMHHRIDLHKARRGDQWRLIEEPVSVAEILININNTEIILIDCLTLWLSNVMLAGKDTASASTELLDAISQCQGKIVCVSNEVGMGIVPENSLGRAFRDAQGTLNQSVAKLSELVIFTAAGLPLTLKGAMPEAPK